MSQEKDVRLEDMAASKAELDDKARKMLEDKDADSRMRIYEGPLGKAIIVLLCVWTAFQLYFTTIGAISAVNLRAIHCIFLLVFTFLLYCYNYIIFIKALQVFNAFIFDRTL